MERIDLFKPIITEAAIEANNRVLRSGWIGLGPETKKFEEEFAEYVGAKYAVAVNSATAGLHLALKAIDTQPGDEIITTPLTFVSTNIVILYEKGIPVFVDIEPDTLNIDPQKIKKEIIRETSAIMCVHYRGHPCEMDTIEDLSDDHGLWVIEDCAHAMGAEYKRRKVGSGNNICVFSFHAVKNLPCGDGGMLTTNNEVIAKTVERLRWLGISKDTYSRTKTIDKSYAWRYWIEEVGYKYYMNDITAAIGREQLKVLDKENERRQEVVNIYKEALYGIPGIKFLEDGDDVRSANHIFVIKAERRDDLILKLKENGITTGVHYYPNHLYPIFEEYRTELPVAESVWKEIISLPLHLQLKDRDMLRVCNRIRGGW